MVWLQQLSSVSQTFRSAEHLVEKDVPKACHAKVLVEGQQETSVQIGGESAVYRAVERGLHEHVVIFF